jgi:hypothetical protein
MCVSGTPGAQSCKCSCEVTFSQPKHSFVIMVATPFWNSGEVSSPAARGADLEAIPVEQVPPDWTYSGMSQSWGDARNRDDQPAL